MASFGKTVAGGRIGAGLAAALAVLAQVQPTIPLFGQETRLAASDPIIAVAAAAALVFLASGVLPLRLWRSRWIWAWLAAMSLVLLASFGIGYAETGVISGWALQNRLLGWLLLMAYLLCGAALRSLYGDTAISTFTVAYVVVGAVIAAGSVVVAVLSTYDLLPLWTIRATQVRGLVANPNAFGLLAVLALAFVWSVRDGTIARFRGPLMGIWAAAGFLTLSRATWIAAIVVGAIAFWQRRPKWRPTLVWTALPVAAAIAFVSLGPVTKLSTRLDQVAQSEPDSQKDVRERERLIGAAVELWSGAPLFGAGLGVHWQRELAAHPARPQLIHGTPLWLLAETGTVGALVFAGFALHAIILLWRGRSEEGPGGTFALAAFAFLLGFAAMSLAHDLLYQRVLWLVLGLGLARPAAEGIGIAMRRSP